MATPVLRGCAALITGASSGIGAAIAAELARLGADVGLAARRHDRLATVRDGIHGGRRIMMVGADVARREDAEKAVNSVVSEFGRLDILVNNAGVMLVGATMEAPPEEWQRMVDVNFMGALYCSHAALPHLVTAAHSSHRGVADLVNISSTAARCARADNAVYSATKHAVSAWSESLRQEVGSRDVRVGVVHPGGTATELSSHNRPAVLKVIEERVAEMRLLEVEDVAATVGFMVSRPSRATLSELTIRPTGH